MYVCRILCFVYIYEMYANQTGILLLRSHQLHNITYPVGQNVKQQREATE